MRILGLETAGAAASVAIWAEGMVKAEYSVHNTRTHSETILPMAERLLGDLSITPGNLDALCVDVGPGSFTGVRIGVCAANAMAAALCLPVIGVDAPTVLSEGAALYAGPVCALIDARNGNAYASLFQNGVCLRGPEAVEVNRYLGELPPNTLFLGDGAHCYEALIRSLCGGAEIAPAHLGKGRAGAMLQAAAKLVGRAGGLSAMPREAAPLYLRPSQAERLWEAAHQ